jgi:hypothetical protein
VAPQYFNHVSIGPNLHKTGYAYHNHRGNDIIDYWSKPFGTIFFEWDMNRIRQVFFTFA